MGTLSSESLPVVECLGRVTRRRFGRASAAPLPRFGYGRLRRARRDTAGATETTPKRLVIGEQAFYVDTGDPLPPDTNSVIMVEDVQVVPGDPSVPTPSSIEIMAATVPWHFVRPMGEDFVATQLVLPSNHQFRPQDLGAAVGAATPTWRCAAGTGCDHPDRHGTGEPVQPRRAGRPQAGRYHRNQFDVLGAMAEEWGCVVNRFAPVPDASSKFVPPWSRL